MYFKMEIQITKTFVSFQLTCFKLLSASLCRNTENTKNNSILATSM